jgi:hypothetical protein
VQGLGKQAGHLLKGSRSVADGSPVSCPGAMPSFLGVHLRACPALNFWEQAGPEGVLGTFLCISNPLVSPLCPLRKC